MDHYLVRNLHTNSGFHTAMHSVGTEIISGVKRPKREPEHSPSSVEVRPQNEWSCTSTPPIRLHGVDRGNITFTFSSY